MGVLLEGKQGKVLGLKITFSWNTNVDVKTTLMLKRKIEQILDLHQAGTLWWLKLRLLTSPIHGLQELTEAGPSQSGPSSGHFRLIIFRCLDRFPILQTSQESVMLKLEWTALQVFSAWVSGIQFAAISALYLVTTAYP